MTGENRRAFARGGFRMKSGAHAKVYRAMWTCPQCEYRNEEWDEACAKCGTAKPVAAPVAAAPAQTAPEAGDATVITVPPAKRAPKRKRKVDPVALLIVLLIVFMLATLTLLGYIAWQRGLIDLPLLGQGGASGLAGAPAGGEVGLEPVALDPVQDLLDSRERGVRPYKKFAEELLQSRANLSGLSAPQPGPDDKLTTEQQAFLDQLNTFCHNLITSFAGFEEQANKDTSLDATGYQGTIAAEYTSQFERVVELIGQVYGGDTSSSHDAYLLPDLIKSSVAVGRRVSLTKIDELWTRAKEARVQRKLDAEHPEEIKQLTARLEALKEVHRQFKAELDALPPYQARAGNLNETGVKALYLLDSLMTGVEKLVEEFQEYTGTFGEMEQSATMKQLQEEFIKLAQEDHFFCFSEICRISVNDRDLEHPAYENLRQHYEFVEQTWSDQAIAYLEAFNNSERDWRIKWKEGGVPPEAAPAPAPEQPAPGATPVAPPSGQ
jgi:hypothetical protein